jgi:hypothetical protein
MICVTCARAIWAPMLCSKRLDERVDCAPFGNCYGTECILCGLRCVYTIGIACLDMVLFCRQLRPRRNCIMTELFPHHDGAIITCLILLPLKAGFNVMVATKRKVHVNI